MSNRMAVCVAEPLKDQNSTMESPISESSGSYFPQVSINVLRALSQRRIRSFGDLLSLPVSDMDSSR